MGFLPDRDCRSQYRKLEDVYPESRNLCMLENTILREKKFSFVQKTFTTISAHTLGSSHMKLMCAGSSPGNHPLWLQWVEDAERHQRS